MGANKPAGVWRTVAQTPTGPLVESDGGDGLNSARKVRDKYVAKAFYLSKLGKDKAVAYYLSAVDALNRYINDPIFVGIDLAHGEDRTVIVEIPA